MWKCSERCISSKQTEEGSHFEYICVDEKLCDYKVDCLNGSDESVTRCGCSGGIECSLTDRCLPSAAACDGYPECGNLQDWTDECFCDYGDYQVQYCNNTGRCLAPWQICDGVDDCGDMSDETFCPSVVMNCEYLPGLKYSCHTFNKKGHRCINIASVCDGYDDCSDASDETICNQPCAAGEIRCASGVSTISGRPSCIPEEMWCDGTAQCLDHSDENYLMCQGVCNQDEDIKQRRCRSLDDSGKYICVNSTNHCDGHIDCAEFEDENSCCANNEYACLNSFDCIADSMVCDASTDCPEGDDELDCFLCDLEINFKCDNLECIPRFLLCNGNNDCKDGSDEGNENIDCSVCDLETNFECKSGECISQALRCDGKADCVDGSDEPEECLSSCSDSEYR
ncbi:vitellogenin receptor-like [Watersipora subatra]|uniref:vitellogenin receptor-like n=1 Tax=Watersipora subatra TaxID=2589382 RepID=UPI00355AFB92